MNLNESLLDSKVFDILKEIYSIPKLDWIENFVNYLFDSPIIDENYINKWDLVLRYENYDDYIIIDQASYSPDTNKITLYLNDNLDILINKNYNRKDVIREIKRFVFHELYHYQQGNNSKGKKPSEEERRKRFEPFRTKKLSDEDSNLLVQEVDAYAKDIARILKDEGYSVQDAIRGLEINSIPMNKFSESELDIIELYRSHYAEWKRFLREVYFYYELER